MSSQRLSADDDDLRDLFSIDDPSIDALEPAARRAIAEVWQGRVESELAVRSRFMLLREGFEALGPNSGPERALASAVADEARHARICAHLAFRYAGLTAQTEERGTEPLVRFGNTDEQTSLLLHLVLVSSINEVASTFFLRDAMKQSCSELARAALRELLADDVEHARIGWAHLASSGVTPAAKHHVSRGLPTLLRLSREAWTRVPENAEPWYRDHGCPGLSVACSAFERAVPEVILPGMAAVGIDAEPAARWFAENVSQVERQCGV